MDDPPNLLTYYERHFADGMTDLSASSPPPIPLQPARLDARDLAYSAPGGSTALRVAIASRYESIGPEHVVVTSGASEALAALALTLVRRGDVVVAEPGTYPALVEAVRAVGGLVVENTSDVAAARIVAFTNPTVPAGQWQDLASRLDAARRIAARAVSDEVYREVVWDGPPPRAACDLDASAVSIGDLSKPLGLGGLRIGWLACRDASLIAAVRRQLQLLSGGPSTPSMALALYALSGFDAAVQSLAETVRDRAAQTYRVLARHGWSFEPAQAGLTVLATPPQPLAEDELRHLRERGWFLVPATVFGFRAGFRISLLHPDQLHAALSELDGARPAPVACAHAGRAHEIAVVRKVENAARRSHRPRGYGGVRPRIRPRHPRPRRWGAVEDLGRRA